MPKQSHPCSQAVSGPTSLSRHGRQTNECRRTLAHAFSDTARRDTGHCVSANVAIFCDQLVLQDACQKGEWGEPKNMSSMANYLTFDILAELCFGKGSFGILTKPDHRHTVELIFHNAWRCMIVCFVSNEEGSFSELTTLTVRNATHHRQTWT